MIPFGYGKVTKYGYKSDGKVISLVHIEMMLQISKSNPYTN